MTFKQFLLEYSEPAYEIKHLLKANMHFMDNPEYGKIAIYEIPYKEAMKKLHGKIDFNPVYLVPSRFAIKRDKKLEESIEKLRKSIDDIINDMHSKGHLDPKLIAKRIKNALEMDLSDEEIIKRYISANKTLKGGSYESML